MNDLAPAYLSELLEPVSHTRCLRSAGHNLLKVPMTSTVSYGDRTFCCCGHKLWNSFPLNIKNSDSLHCVKRALKTHLFKQYYNV